MAQSSATADLSWAKLISEKPTTRQSVRICDDQPKEVISDETFPRQRRESLMGTFHRHLRMSLKAVNDSGPMTRQTRFSSRRVRKRVIFKHGDVNVVQGNVAKRRRRYMQDIFTTLVDIQWRWTILVFALNFTLSWLFLGVVWYLIAYAHGDIEFFDEMSKAEDPEIYKSLTNHTPCVTEIKSFLSAFLFSLETQHTIGE
jgi:hypothetical protein